LFTHLHTPQELEAAKARAEADKKKAQLAAQVKRLRAKLGDLSDQAAAKQEAVKLELQKAKMQKELELQVCVWLVVDSLPVSSQRRHMPCMYTSVTVRMTSS
jgi:hypothetical protein